MGAAPPRLPAIFVAPSPRDPPPDDGSPPPPPTHQRTRRHPAPTRQFQERTPPSPPLFSSCRLPTPLGSTTPTLAPHPLPPPRAPQPRAAARCLAHARHFSTDENPPHPSFFPSPTLWTGCPFSTTPTRPPSLACARPTCLPCCPTCARSASCAATAGRPTPPRWRRRRPRSRRGGRAGLGEGWGLPRPPDTGQPAATTRRRLRCATGSSGAGWRTHCGALRREPASFGASRRDIGTVLWVPGRGLGGRGFCECLCVGGGRGDKAAPHAAAADRAPTRSDCQQVMVGGTASWACPSPPR